MGWMRWWRKACEHIFVRVFTYQVFVMLSRRSYASYAFFFFHPLRVFSGTQHFRQPFSDINFS